MNGKVTGNVITAGFQRITVNGEVAVMSSSRGRCAVTV